MAERIGTIENRRWCRAQAAQNPASSKEISHDGFAARNELVGQDVPRTSLETAGGEQRRELGRAFGSDLEIVLEHDGLTIEEKTLAVAGRMVEELVDERDETLAESNEWMVPLAIPVRVRDDVSS